MTRVAIRYSEQGQDIQVETIQRTAPPSWQDKEIEVTLVLRQPKLMEEIQRRLKSMESQTLTQRRYLTHEELERLAADEQHEAAVKRFAKESGLRIKDAGRSTCMVKMVGTVDAVANAFAIEFEYFEMPRMHLRKVQGRIKLPRYLASAVDGVFGLHAMFPIRQHHRVLTTEASRAVRKSKDPGLLGYSGMYTATEVAKLYNLPAALDGTGQCLGIILPLGDFDDQDIVEYFKLLGLRAPLITRHNRNESKQDAIADFEATLDVEIAAAICPGAHIVVYGSKAGKMPDMPLRRVVHALESAVFDKTNKPSVLSLSYVFPELGPIYKLLGRKASETSEELSMDNLLKIAACLGITVCVASGDRGSVAPMGAGAPDLFVFSVPNYPATSPYVLACGGTTLESSKGKITNEVVWGQIDKALIATFPYTRAIGGLSGSGGGVSRHYPLPSYQKGARVPHAVTTFVDDGLLVPLLPYKGRGVPDVAANADPYTGWKLIFRHKESVGGGTSAAAPFWAGFMACINQGLSQTLGRHQSAGWVNPQFYELQINQDKNIFRTITQGCNGGYVASPDHEWNACTGLGSPDGARLAEALGVSLPANKPHRRTTR